MQKKRGICPAEAKLSRLDVLRVGKIRFSVGKPFSPVFTRLRERIYGRKVHRIVGARQVGLLIEKLLLRNKSTAA